MQSGNELKVTTTNKQRGGFFEVVHDGNDIDLRRFYV